MKTTIYELIRMINDGTAPKKIKYREMIYHICYDYGDYESDIEEYRSADIKEHYYLFEGIDIFKNLNNEVEILKEEKKIPEKIKDKYCSQISKVELAQKYNEIIDYLNSKGDE